RHFPRMPLGVFPRRLEHGYAPKHLERFRIFPACRFQADARWLKQGGRPQESRDILSRDVCRPDFSFGQRPYDLTAALSGFRQIAKNLAFSGLILPINQSERIVTVAGGSAVNPGGNTSRLDLDREFFRFLQARAFCQKTVRNSSTNSKTP